MINKQDKTQMTTLALNGQWQFCQADEQQWRSATVPGCNFTDLLAHQLIDDPFVQDNESHLQWIEKKDWHYRRAFNITAAQLAHSEVKLVALGLDTFCDIYLNGQPLASGQNMFVGQHLACRSLLIVGQNEIEVRFRSPMNEVYPQFVANGFTYPAENDKSDEKLSVFCRKAPCHFGWDWGPKFVTSGIWRDIYLAFIDTLEIKDVHFVQQSLSAERAQFRFDLDVSAMADFSGQVRVTCAQAPQLNQTQSINVLAASAGQTISLDFSLTDPQRWWPNGVGDAFIYDFNFELITDEKVLAEHSLAIGLREIEVVNQTDDMGESFYFKVNGHPVFMKGSNYIPDDSFIHRVTAERHQQLFDGVVAGNMNMLRVWGGGIYQDDKFYELADRNGILIWQDFMFACTLYPANEAFLHNVKQEAEYNVKRLRNHPCIAMWCGNNEVDMAIEKWQWAEKFAYSDELYTRLKQDYMSLFDDCLPSVVSELDSQRFYLRSSPIGFWENDEDNKANHHYWGVWHGEEPFSEYKKRIPRFMSEYGFQSFPIAESTHRFTRPEDRELESTVMQVHQKHPRGNKLIRSYMDEEFNPPKDFEQLLYLSQVQQALGLKMAFEAHRAAMPFCMGTLYWQLNDTWPAASWSGIDYYGRWKALHYQAKRSFAQQLLVIEQNDDSLDITLISDRLTSFSAQLHVSLYQFNGEVLWSHEQSVKVAANASQEIFSLEFAKLVTAQQLSRSVMTASLVDVKSAQTLAQNTHFFAPNKDLALQSANIVCTKVIAHEQLTLTFDTDTFVRQLYVSVSGHDGNFNDNFFDLIPMQPKTICLSLPRMNNKDITALVEKLSWSSLIDSFASQQSEIESSVGIKP
ncbi:beta-mannosidase [Paraglaciecola polaris]|uniref:Beta-mannosidase B n=1 Tax=Paraglaciecola polaris LMG 21857 TaxID=1129793 RepID=K6ZXW0_9ALTE|nr:glycoside hydrolase family 2 protein [Paraglaciecola polaris]GAC35067.1 beta-mannosidase [Paraglaciecola polaris LMG 21857]